MIKQKICVKQNIVTKKATHNGGTVCQHCGKTTEEAVIHHS